MPLVTPSALWKSGAFLGASGVALGAYGAHGLSKFLVDRGTNATTIATAKSTWSTAASYQIFSSLALLVISQHPRFSRHRFAGPLILLGAIGFSGSIYALILAKSKVRFLGPVTPLGGLLMIAGWLSLAF